MVGQVVDERLLYELAPPLTVSGRPAVVAYLRQLIQDPSPARWTPGLKDALRLAALTYQVANRVAGDLRLVPRPAMVRRWRPEVERGWRSVPASSLMWGGFEPKDVQPLPRTQPYLDDLSEAIVARALDWAPAVVMPVGRHGVHWVIASHVPALLARQRRPDADIRVRVLRGVVSRQRTLPDVCAGAVQLLGPLFRRYRRFLAGFAADDWEAQFLTGYSRAHYFRIKEEAGGRQSRTLGGVSGW